jgi:hypothetical protein
MNKRNTQQRNTQRGQVIIINTLLFFALSTAIIFAVTHPVVSSFQVTQSFLKSKKAFLVANSASNEALYKLNANMELASAETVTLAQGTADIIVADTGDTKTVSIESDVETYERNYEISLSQGEGVSFNYGLQVGQGGFEMSGGAGINGNVYSNGDITGTGGPYITGSAVSSNISDPVIVTSNNGGTIDPPAEIQFGGNATPQDMSQSFTVATTTPVSSIRILIKKSGSAWMNNVTMRITSDNSGKPSKTTLAQGTISASTVTTTFNYLTIPLSSTVALTPGTTYWLVFDTSTTWGQYYALGANDGAFADGTAKTGSWSSSNGGTWANTSPSTLDSYFDVYVGGSTGIISGITVGSGGIGDAWAFEVNNSTVAGTIYCQAGTGNNKSCDTSRSNPVQQAFPISDGNIQDWKDVAAAGGATSTVSMGGSEVRTIGPVKINGNLSVGSGAILNVEGTIHVTGNVSVSGGGIVRVSPSLGATSAIIIADGKVSAGGGGVFQGSGTSGSYILLVTTSTCPTGSGCSGDNAIEVSGGTGAVVLNAQSGTIEFSGGAQAKQATANKIIMGGGTTVTYESGLANQNFTSGPSGSWTINSWKEVE